MTPRKPHRMARVNSALRDAVAEALGEVKDARLGIVSVTEVRTSADLRNATVFLSIFGDEAAVVASRAALDAAWGFVARTVVRRVPLRRAPLLVWREDTTIADADRIERLLRDRG